MEFVQASELSKQNIP